MGLDLTVEWVVRDVDEQKVQELMRRFELPILVAKLICMRGIGIDDIAIFLRPLLKSSMPDPFHLIDMDKAVARIAQAIRCKQNIVIYGDYDVDGACSSSVLKLYLAKLGVQSNIYIPDRINEGYGPNKDAMTYLCCTLKADLCITVDCGTSAHAELAHAKEIGLDVIVIDHHIGQDELPEAEAVVNPNRVDQGASPCSKLAAVGIVFMVLVALNKVLREEQFFVNAGIKEPNLFAFLDLVALGTVCDVMPITGLNRAFVCQGLKIMEQRSNVGLSSLISFLNIQEELEVYHLGYVIGPTINAGGRVGRSSLGAEMLAGSDSQAATSIASELYWCNQKRKSIESAIVRESMLQIDEVSENFAMVIGRGWHQGVIGIVASRVKDVVNMPVAVVSIDEQGIGKGSARSIPGVDIGSLVLQAKDCGLIEEGGGHAMAAGFTIREDKILALKQFFVDRIHITCCNKMFADASLSLDSANMELVEQIESLAPFGAGNPDPIFIISDVKVVYSKIVGELHINCILASCFSNYSVRAIAFRGVEKHFGTKLLHKEKISFVVGKIKREKWNGSEGIRVLIEDVV